jgi:exodeoxyribonuclease VII small subunit
MPRRSRPSVASQEGSPPSFDADLTRLEALVERLEQGARALEESLAVFEEGVHLSRRLAEQLEHAERRVEILLREGEELVARPFQESEGSGS